MGARKREGVNKSILTAANGEKPGKYPVWFMRQAGRSLPEYRKAREGIPMIEACLTPDLVAEITAQPVRRHKVDAAIFFSDIVVPLRLAGIGVEIVPGVGPVIAEPVRTRSDVAKIADRCLEDEDLISRGLAAAAREVEVPVIGFAGAPFTVAAYLVEGKGTRDHLAARAMMHADPQAWDALLSWVARITRRFLEVQIEAGAQLVQLFDSWAGSLSRADYEAHVLPYSRRVLADLPVPAIHFGTGTGAFLDLMAEPAEVIGVDYRTPLDEAARRAPGKPVQGNINPAMLTAPWEVLREHIDAVLRAGAAAPAHIVNLGHGVPPTTDPAVLTRVVEYVHSRSPQEVAAS